MGLLQRSIVLLALDFVAFPHQDSHNNHACIHILLLQIVEIVNIHHSHACTYQPWIYVWLHQVSDSGIYMLAHPYVQRLIRAQCPKQNKNIHQFVSFQYFPQCSINHNFTFSLYVAHASNKKCQCVCLKSPKNRQK